MAQVRSRFLGVWNIFRFNWHFYAGALGIGLVALSLAAQWDNGLRYAIYLGVAAMALQIAVSLIVSHFVYDRSDLYSLSILDDWISETPTVVVNIHAGFDETSGILKDKFPSADLKVWDFYDPENHTEVSIRRARSAYPPSTRQLSISTNRLPMNDKTADIVCLLLAAHEIRKPEEQISFFAETRRILKDDGRIVMIEHLRDAPNFLAFSLGYFHFFSGTQWRRVVEQADLVIRCERKITPFLSAFLIQKS